MIDYLTIYQFLHRQPGGEVGGSRFQVRSQKIEDGSQKTEDRSHDGYLKGYKLNSEI